MIRRILSLFLLTVPALAADLTFFWEANDPAEEVIAYRLYSATNVTGPYTLAATTTNGLQTNLAVTNVVQGQGFYYVTASNFWGESVPSAGVNTPKIVRPVKSLLLILSPDARRYVAALAADRRPKPPLPK
jgi:hypothetical protein